MCQNQKGKVPSSLQLDTECQDYLHRAHTSKMEAVYMQTERYAEQTKLYTWEDSGENSKVMYLVMTAPVIRKNR